MPSEEHQEVALYEDAAQEQNHVLEIYKVAVDSTHRVTEGRLASHKFFLTLGTGIMGVEGWALSKDAVIPAFVAGFGIAVGLVWWSYVDSWKRLNSAKFKVIDKIERRLPLAFFRDEWSILKGGHHTTLTTIERSIPALFAAIQLAVFMYALGGVVGLVK